MSFNKSVTMCISGIRTRNIIGELYMNDTLLKEPWLKWAIDIQSIAQCGLSYAKDAYDIER